MSNPDLSKPLWQFIVAKKGKLRYNSKRDTNAKKPAEGKRPSQAGRLVCHNRKQRFHRKVCVFNRFRLDRKGRIMMLELSKERIGKILHEETVQEEKLTTILRAVYTRYMRLYENYYEDIDALNKTKIAELKKYHEETVSLIKYYYLDIPHDICEGIEEFENKFTANMLGPDWHRFLFRNFEEFKDNCEDRRAGKEALKEAFTKQALQEFYDTMGYVFREGFDTDSKTVKDTISGFDGLFGGKEE